MVCTHFLHNVLCLSSAEFNVSIRILYLVGGIKILKFGAKNWLSFDLFEKARATWDWPSDFSASFRFRKEDFPSASSFLYLNLDILKCFVGFF